MSPTNDPWPALLQLCEALHGEPLTEEQRGVLRAWADKHMAASDGRPGRQVPGAVPPLASRVSQQVDASVHAIAKAMEETKRARALEKQALQEAFKNARNIAHVSEGALVSLDSRSEASEGAVAPPSRNQTVPPQAEPDASALTEQMLALLQTLSQSQATEAAGPKERSPAGSDADQIEDDILPELRRELQLQRVEMENIIKNIDSRLESISRTIEDAVQPRAQSRKK